MSFIKTKNRKWKEVAVDGVITEKAKELGIMGIEVVDPVKSKAKSDKKERTRTSEKNGAANPVKTNRKKRTKKKKSEQKPSESEAGNGGGDGAKDRKRKAEDSATAGPKNKKKRKKRKANKNEGAKKTDSSVPEDQNADLDMSAWDGLFVPEVVQRALRRHGFSQPTDIQRAVLPAAIKGRMDVLGAAETGSGKTLAFAIPIIHGILQDRRREEEAEEDGEDGEASSEEAGEEKELISDEEFEDMSDEEGDQAGCVKVVNDVVFDFDDEGEFFAPPLELFEPAKSESAAAAAPGKRLRALVLAPTRELAMQVKAHIERAAAFTDLGVAVVVGGMSAQKQERVLGYGPEIVVATPGRLWDLIEEGNPHLATVADLDYLAIDETDRMTEKGHFEELKQLLELINRDEAKKGKRQNFVFSATLSLVHDLPKHLVGKKRARAVTAEEKLEQVMDTIGVKEKARRKVVDLTSKTGTARTLTESRIHCDVAEKDVYLYYFTQMHPGRTLVFCNSIDCVRRLVNLFSLLRCRPLGLHAQMHQKQRLKNLDRFVSDPAALLIASDVAARGLDINNVQHVIHYQVPKTSESYVHRSGRTARASKEGLSVILIDSSESLSYKKICHTLKRVEDLPLFPVDSSVYSSVKARMQRARELDKLKLGARKKEVEKSWWKRAAEEAELVLSESEGEGGEAEEERGGKTKARAVERQRIAQKQAELDALLDVPLTSMGFSGKYPTKTGRLEMPDQFTDKSSKSAVSALKEDADRSKELLNARKSGSKQKRFKKRRSKGKNGMK